jgi:hypothetical protein
MMKQTCPNPEDYSEEGKLGFTVGWLLHESSFVIIVAITRTGLILLMLTI